uniref:Uncharacterized protein n=1 Tax=Onchocerca volvulus TaxID=6282 RepID=A0A2K6VNU9_ONCVO
MKKKKQIKPQESILLGTTIDTKSEHKKGQSSMKTADSVPQPTAVDKKPTVEKTTMIEFERKSENQQNKSSTNKKSADDDQKNEENKLTISKTQIQSLRNEQTQEDTQMTQITSLESSGKSRSRKDKLKDSKLASETGSHATSKQEEFPYK